MKKFDIISLIVPEQDIHANATIKNNDYKGAIKQLCNDIDLKVTKKEIDKISKELEDSYSYWHKEWYWFIVTEVESPCQK